MAQKRIPKKLNQTINDYVSILKADGLPVARVILFGSYAKGKSHKWSDVDLCIISPKFKHPYNAMQYLLLKAPFNMKYTIEPIGFSPKDFSDPYDSLIHEIKTHGIEIPLKKTRKS